MSFRTPTIALIATLALTTACTNKKVSNPLAKLDSKQPDKVLFDRGIDSMKHNHFDVARLDMQTLINTYPESEFIARAKLALADSWYAEGGSAGLAQAEQEYRDFETFFPNMPEAAEAQLKIANIQFQQMEKPDRDYTHAVRAEDEYRKVMLQYPDNQQMVAEAKIKLLQVQEVIAEREFRVGRFYYLQPSYPAAIARLQSLVDRYPLYSQADEALYLTGQSYEGEANLMRHADVTEREQLEKTHKLTKAQIEAQIERDRTGRQPFIDSFEKQAGEAYSKILTRYPAMKCADEAKARLVALHQPVPRPTKAMLAQNKAEEDSRKHESITGALMGTVERHPDVSAAANVGEPSLQDQDLKDPGQIVKQALAGATKVPASKESLTVQTTDVKPGENQPAPRSDAPVPTEAQSAADTSAQPPAQPDPNELKPSPAAAGTNQPGSDQSAAANDPNELKPNVASDPPPAPAPAQVNDIQNGDPSSAAPAQAAKPATSSPSVADGQDLATDADLASSKHKKKKGLHKVIPLN
jgi:outer membrane protein assembly factor BamD